MNYYLAKEQLRSSIGKGIEQWLGFEHVDGDVVLKWLRIYQDHPNFIVMYMECFDEGNSDFLDIYEFSMVDPDEPYGIINTFSSLETAITFAVQEYGASNEKFVHGGMIQEEYLSYLKH